MTPRQLKIALGVSVALNLFAIGALASGAILGPRLAREEAPPPARVPMLQVVESLPEAQRDTVRQTLRENALAARPDFREARQARVEAVELASSPRFDRAVVTEALARSTAAEMRGRARLEQGALDMLEALPPEQRADLAPILTKTGARHRRHRGDRDGRNRNGGNRRAERSAEPPAATE